MIINDIHVVEKQDPFCVDKWAVYSYLEFEKMHMGIEIYFIKKENAIRFINEWNTRKDNEDIISLFKEIQESMPEESDLLLMYENIVDDYEDANKVINKVGTAKVRCYYDTYGRERKVLVNSNLCPFSTLNLYSNEKIFSEDGVEYDNVNINGCLKENEDDDAPRKLLYTNLFKEDDHYFYFKISPAGLETIGFLRQFENTYSYNQFIDFKIDKKTLMVVCDQEPKAFSGLRIKNIS